MPLAPQIRVVPPERTTLPLRPIDIASPEGRAAVALLGLERAFSVPLVALVPHGQCYWGVKATVDEHGGRSLPAWNLTWWKGVLASANHHAVWETPLGDMVDITAALANTPTNPAQSTIVLDSAAFPDTSVPPLVANRDVALCDDPMVGELLRLTAGVHKSMREHQRVLKLLGVKYSQGEGWVVGPHHQQDARHQRLNARIQQDLSRIRALHDRLLKRHGAVPL